VGPPVEVIQGLGRPAAGAKVSNAWTLTITYALGIQNFQGTLTLNASRVSNNASSRQGGGGIENIRGTVTLNSSQVSGNTGGLSGGGIENGGIESGAGTSALTLRASSVSGNKAGKDGGGIFNGLGSTATLQASSVSGNTAGGQGGGIFNDGSVRLLASLVTGNHPGNCAPSGSVSGCRN
jgi:hypothetical protein